MNWSVCVYVPRVGEANSLLSRGSPRVMGEENMGGRCTARGDMSGVEQASRDTYLVIQAPFDWC